MGGMLAGEGTRVGPCALGPLLCAAMGLAAVYAGAADKWWDEQWPYRVTLETEPECLTWRSRRPSICRRSRAWPRSRADWTATPCAWWT